MTLVSFACTQNYSGLLTPVLQWLDKDDRLLSAINLTTIHYVTYNLTLPYRGPVLYGIQVTCQTRFHRPEYELPHHASNVPDFASQNLTWKGELVLLMLITIKYPLDFNRLFTL